MVTSISSTERLASWISILIDPDRVVDCYVINGHETRPKAVITAGIHGDEYEGMTAVRDLISKISVLNLRGSVWLIPVANPTALAAGTRLNPEDGKNLARTFPGNLAGSPTEQLAARLFEQIGDADYLIDLHSGGVEYEFVPVAGFYGEAKRSNCSFAAAQHFGMDALWQLPDTPGVLSYELSRRGTCVVGCEYLGAGRLSTAGRRRYQEGILECLNLWSILPQSHRALQQVPSFTGDWLLSSVEGIFESRVELGATVDQGCEVAVITSARGNILQRFTAPVSGKVLGLRSKAYIRSGNWGVLLGQDCEVTNG